MSTVSDPVEQSLRDAASAVPDATLQASCGGERIVTARVLRDLARAWPGPLGNDHRESLDAICRKLAVGHTLLACYDRNWRPLADRTPLPLHAWSLATAVLLAWSRDADNLGPDGRAFALKLRNAAMTAIDLCPDVPGRLRAAAETQLAAIPHPENPDAVASPAHAPRCPVAPGLRTLPLTVLAYEGPCARAYLAALRRAGLRPRRIVLLVLSEHPGSHKPVGRWFPGRMRSWYAEKAQDQALNYWPRRIQAACPQLVQAIANGLAPVIERPGELIEQMYGQFDYDNCADAVDRVIVRNLRDDTLRDHLASVEPRTVLFTGGGILPASVVNLPDVCFLHVHPGHLPFVRGADGLLWSTLVRGRPAMSCFWLATGLDTGDLIAVREYAPLTFDLPGRETLDDQTLYRAIFAFIDPLLRADALTSTFQSVDGDVQRLESTRQDPTRGTTFHFMHPRLRRIALARLFG